MYASNPDGSVKLGSSTNVVLVPNYPAGYSPDNPTPSPSYSGTTTTSSAASRVPSPGTTAPAPKWSTNFQNVELTDYWQTFRALLLPGGAAGEIDYPCMPSPLSSYSDVGVVNTDYFANCAKYAKFNTPAPISGATQFHSIYNANVGADTARLVQAQSAAGVVSTRVFEQPLVFGDVGPASGTGPGAALFSHGGIYPPLGGDPTFTTFPGSPWIMQHIQGLTTQTFMSWINVETGATNDMVQDTGARYIFYFTDAGYNAATGDHFIISWVLDPGFTNYAVHVHAIADPSTASFATLAAFEAAALYSFSDASTAANGTYLHFTQDGYTAAGNGVEAVLFSPANAVVESAVGATVFEPVKRIKHLLHDIASGLFLAYKQRDHVNPAFAVASWFELPADLLEPVDYDWVDSGVIAQVADQPFYAPLVTSTSAGGERHYWGTGRQITTDVNGTLSIHVSGTTLPTYTGAGVATTGVYRTAVYTCPNQGAYMEIVLDLSCAGDIGAIGVLTTDTDLTLDLGSETDGACLLLEDGAMSVCVNEVCTSLGVGPVSPTVIGMEFAVNADNTSVDIRWHADGIPAATATLPIPADKVLMFGARPHNTSCEFTFRDRAFEFGYSGGQPALIDYPCFAGESTPTYVTSDAAQELVIGSEITDLREGDVDVELSLFSQANDYLLIEVFSVPAALTSLVGDSLDSTAPVEVIDDVQVWLCPTSELIDPTDLLEVEVIPKSEAFDQLGSELTDDLIELEFIPKSEASDLEDAEAADVVETSFTATFEEIYNAFIEPEPETPPLPTPGEGAVYVMNANTTGMTYYTGVDVVAVIEHEGVPLFLVGDEIQQHDTEADKGVPIAARLRTGKLDFGTQADKHLHRAYVTGLAANGLEFTTHSYEHGAPIDRAYTLPAQPGSDSHTRYKGFGRGAVSPYWELQVDNIGGGPLDFTKLAVLTGASKRPR